MNKENLDQLMKEYYYEKNDVETTISFLYTMADLYIQLNDKINQDIHKKLETEYNRIIKNEERK